MSEPVSRQALEELAAYQKILQVTDHGGNVWSEGESVFGLAQAILDAPPLEWCETHEANSSKWAGVCWAFDMGDDPCQFQTYVRVKVDP